MLGDSKRYKVLRLIAIGRQDFCDRRYVKIGDDGEETDPDGVTFIVGSVTTDPDEVMKAGRAAMT